MKILDIQPGYLKIDKNIISLSGRQKKGGYPKRVIPAQHWYLSHTDITVTRVNSAVSYAISDPLYSTMASSTFQY